MAKATIKSQSGATITVEGTDREVSNIISEYERTSVVGQARQSVARSQLRKKDEKKRESASDLIVAMKENDFFDKPKTLGEISNALEEKGYLYAVTSLSGIVLGLVKKGILRRKRVEKRWVYGK